MQFIKVSLVVVFMIFIHAHALALPANDIAAKGELSDLNAKQQKINKDTDDDDEDINSAATAIYSHNDGDLAEKARNLETKENLKYDVETLEPSDLTKTSGNLEEQFREPSIKTNTNIFTDEDIEMHHVPGLVEENHLVWSFVLIGLGLVAVGIYVGLVSWRSYLERRYGTRQLISTCENDDFDNDSTVLPADLIIANIVGSNNLQQQQQQQQPQHQYEHLQKQLQQHHLQWQRLQQQRE